MTHNNTDFATRSRSGRIMQKERGIRMKKRLYDEYIRRLLEVNDESKTDDEHRQIEARFRGWLEGVEDAAGYRFNGDHYYIKLFDSGKMQERPLCCGVFLDWKSNAQAHFSEVSDKRA